MYRRAGALIISALAIALFMIEYVLLIWPSLYVTVLRTCTRANRANAHLSPRARYIATRRAVKHAAAQWYAAWGAHLWRWIRPLLQIKATIELPQEFVGRDGQPFQPIVLVSNHQNSLDALIILTILWQTGLGMTWIGKREMRRVPGVGWLLVLLDAALVGRRGDPWDIVLVRKSAIRARHDGFSYGVFPEGHRRSKQPEHSHKRSRHSRKPAVPLFKNLGNPRTNGLTTVCRQLPGYPMLVLTIDWSCSGTTMLDAEQLFGSSVAVKGELWYGITDRDPKEIETFIYDRWSEMDTALSASKL